MVHQVKFKYFQTLIIQLFSLTDRQTDRQTDRLSSSLMTFREHSFLSWREKKDSKIVSIASFAALTEEDIVIIRQHGFNIV